LPERERVTENDASAARLTPTASPSSAPTATIDGARSATAPSSWSRETILETRSSSSTTSSTASIWSSGTRCSASMRTRLACCWSSGSTPRPRAC